MGLLQPLLPFSAARFAQLPASSCYMTAATAATKKPLLWAPKIRRRDLWAGDIYKTKALTAMFFSLIWALGNTQQDTCILVLLPCIWLSETDHLENPSYDHHGF